MSGEGMRTRVRLWMSRGVMGVKAGRRAGRLITEEEEGGRVKMNFTQFLVVNGGAKVGGGSIFITAYKMTGIGQISACGGNGYGGWGGGRVSVNILSRHDDPKIFVHVSDILSTLLLEFPFQPLWTNVYIQDKARVTCPLLWSRVQVQGQISLLCGGVLSFGLAHYGTSVFGLLAEELLMSDSTINVYGALRMTVKMFLMWNSELHIDGGGGGGESGNTTVSTSILEASNLFVLRESSVIRSSANLGVHGQGLLNLIGPGGSIEAQRLVLSLFYQIYVGPGSILRGPLLNASRDAVTPKLYCDRQDCPYEPLSPPEDCNVNSSLCFTLHICRVEDIIVQGFIKGSVVHFHRAKTVTLEPSGEVVEVVCVEGGITYGNAQLPCELGSGSGDYSPDYSSSGGGIVVIGSVEQPLSGLSLKRSIRADGESVKRSRRDENGSVVAPGGGSGGTALLFLRYLSRLFSQVVVGQAFLLAVVVEEVGGFIFIGQTFPLGTYTSLLLV
ncbi:hypothetical protein Rs2_11846 [Raphanus sativus]|nr:hypothetical protein Rs2_11846 [Raphanus sativus]